MGYKENNLIKRVLLSAKANNQRLVRINSGMGWISEKSVRVTKPTPVTVYPGDILLRKARPFHGAPEGTPDICGFTSVTVTQDMVGKKVAIFTGLEVKATGNLRPRQKKVGDMIRRMGGRFEVVRESWDAEQGDTSPDTETDTSPDTSPDTETE